MNNTTPAVFEIPKAFDSKIVRMAARHGFDNINDYLNFLLSKWVSPTSKAKSK